MANQEQVEMLKRSVSEWNQWRGTMEGPSYYIDLSGANLFNTDLRGANLNVADLSGATLWVADLSNAELDGANLTGANLSEANLSGARFEGAILDDTDLRGATLDSRTVLLNVILTDSNLRLADVIWGGANLTNVDWSPIRTLGDEKEARKDNSRWPAALRANRQFAVVLRNQGLKDEADRFAYRAQICQRRMQRQKGLKSVGTYLGSVILDFLAGYGYKPGRTILLYLLTILIFSGIYMQFGIIDGHYFSFHEAIIFSLTSFHGRGFFPSGLSLDAPIVTIAAIEAVIGLLVEISFIATFSRRFLGD